MLMRRNNVLKSCLVIMQILDYKVKSIEMPSCRIVGWKTEGDYVLCSLSFQPYVCIYLGFEGQGSQSNTMQISGTLQYKIRNLISGINSWPGAPGQEICMVLNRLVSSSKGLKLECNFLFGRVVLALGNLEALGKCD